MNRQPTKVIEDIILSALKELADPQYQERVWVQGSVTEVGSLNEATAALFNDSGLDEALEKNRVTFSHEVDAELRDLRSTLRSCLEQQSREGIQKVISAPEWSLVREKAARLRTALTTRA